MACNKTLIIKFCIILKSKNLAWNYFLWPYTFIFGSKKKTLSIVQSYRFILRATRFLFSAFRFRVKNVGGEREWGGI